MHPLRARLQQNRQADAQARTEVDDRLPQPLSGAEIVTYPNDEGRTVWEIWAGGVYIAHGDPELDVSRARRRAHEALTVLGLAA